MARASEQRVRLRPDCRLPPEPLRERPAQGRPAQGRRAPEQPVREQPASEQASVEPKREPPMSEPRSPRPKARSMGAVDEGRKMAFQTSLATHRSRRALMQPTILGKPHAGIQRPRIGFECGVRMTPRRSISAFGRFFPAPCASPRQSATSEVRASCASGENRARTGRKRFDAGKSPSDEGARKAGPIGGGPRGLTPPSCAPRRARDRAGAGSPA